MDDLVTWLRTQLDEDEQWARRILVPPTDWREVQIADAVISGFARRVLAEVDAKRRILDHCVEMLRPDSAWGGPTDPDSLDPGAWYVLRLLALPYADRPGCRDEWRP